MNIYILKLIKLKKKTEDEIITEWINHINNYPMCIMAKSEYEKLLIDTNKNYYFSCEDNSYYSNLDIAINNAKTNILDISDNGVFNYIVIAKVELDKIYVNSYIEEAHLLKLNYDKYDVIDFSLNEDTLFIKKILEIL